MISIVSYHSTAFLLQVATEWYNKFKLYMTQVQEAGHEFQVIENGHRKTFQTRLEKMEYLVQSDAAFQRLTQPQQDNILSILNELINVPTQYVIADKDRMKELAAKQKGEWSYVVPILKRHLVSLYEEFTAIEDNSYAILAKLNITTCPYCNRNYTFTIRRMRTNDFKTRAEFDHFYDKSEYPLLALSFFNLVPSCHTCNHGKLTDAAKLNPYFEGFSSHFAIVEYDKDECKDQNSYVKLNVNDILQLKSPQEFSVAIPTATADEKINISTFGLDKLYNHHKDYILEIVDKANAYNSIGADNLINTFQGIGRTPLDVYNFVWGKNLSDTELLNRPLSKLTKDILVQMGLQQ